MTVGTTQIRGSWLVAWNGDEHEIISDGACLVENDRIVEVGKSAEITPGDRQIDLQGSVLIPGLINTHLHAGFNARDSVLLDVDRKGVVGRNYLNWQAGVKGHPRFESDPEPSITFGFAQCLLSGVTTAIEFGAGGDGGALLRAADRTGVRVYSGLSYRNATMFSDDNGVIEYVWEDVEPKFQRALEFAEVCDRATDMVQPILCPGHPDTCDIDVLERTREIAESRGWPITIHAGLHLKEFERTYDMYGCSPYELLDRVGLLGPKVVVAHAIFHREHSLSMFAGADLDLMGDRHAVNSHAPVKFAHLGIQMESVQRYADAGISITMGTDTSNPADLICEMRQGMVASRIADRSFTSAPPRLMFDAATVNAADALGRPDLGRLAAGTKADIVAVDLSSLRFGAIHDPIRSLIECGSASDVKWVMVDGRVVVENGELSGIDQSELLDLAQEDGRKTWDDIPNWYPGQRSIDEIVPPSYPMR